MAKVSSLDRQLAIARRLALDGSYAGALVEFDAVLEDIARWAQHIPAGCNDVRAALSWYARCSNGSRQLHCVVKCTGV